MSKQSLRKDRKIQMLALSIEFLNEEANMPCSLVYPLQQVVC